MAGSGRNRSDHDKIAIRIRRKYKGFFMQTNWKYNSIKEIAEAFTKPEIKAVSFDLFDTLVVRPLEKSTDVYELLDHSFGELTAGADAVSISFQKLRVEAEAVLRRQIQRGETHIEDITLTDIYEVLETQFYIEKELAHTMMEKEIELECSLSSIRQSGKWLWEQASLSGKKVIIVSDMYLEKKHMQKLLEKNGYTGYRELYVSSEIGKRKITGNLYKYVTDQLAVLPEEIFHVGDNEDSDCRIASANGWQCAWLPSTMHQFDQNGCSHQVEKICSDLTNWEAARLSVGIGAMRQLAANKYFDDPFRDFAKESDYNNDPYFVGYAALGMELLALTKWIAESALRDNIKNMIFMSRDGYLLKLAYDMYREIHPDLPESQYLYVSRRSVLASIIQGPSDLYDLPIDITYQTPSKLMKLLSFCDKCDNSSSHGSHKSEREEEDGFFAEQRMKPDENFNKDSFQEFIRDFIQYRYDAKKHKAAKQHIADYMKYNKTAKITSASAIFDMGYSGRIPAAIINAAGIHPQVYYFHTDAKEHFRYEKRSGMKIRSFFDFNPYMESSLREYSYLEPTASCIGYTEDFEEIFDIGPAKGYAESAQSIQKGSLDLIRDYLAYFGVYEKEADFRNHDAAMPFEAFIRYCSSYDKGIYEKVLMDDELWGGRRDINLKYLIETRCEKMPAYAKPQNNE